MTQLLPPRDTENRQKRDPVGKVGLGVDRSFDPARDYYVNFRDLNPNAPTTILGAPLLATSGMVRPPARNEIVVPTGITDYVGVRPDAEATVDLMYVNANPPIVRRFENLRLIGTFELVGPDQGDLNHFGVSLRAAAKCLLCAARMLRTAWQLRCPFS
jgi:hypothetical protein